LTASSTAPDRRAPIPRAKLEGLRQALAAGVVTFHTGRTAELEDCPECGGRGRVPEPDYPLQPPESVTRSKACPRCEGAKFRIVVTGTANGRSWYRLDDGPGLERAYKMALFGPAPIPQPTSKRDFGDDPPF
jgi:hypothetical protein